MSIKVLLGDDHKVVRQGLRALLEKEPDIEVIGEAEDGLTAVRMVEELMPAVVIMDICMPDLNGIEATRQIIARAPAIKVVALSMYSDKRFVLSMMKAGASGYLLKDCAFEELVQAIRTVAINRTYLSPSIADMMIKDYIRQLQKHDLSAFSFLTAREREVLQLLAEGKTIKEIAAQLYVSVKTIGTHRQKMMDKLNIHNVAELTKYAVREGIASP